MKILLVCNEGMSTGIMQIRLSDVIQKDGEELEVEAVPMANLHEYLDEAAVVLLGPQIRFAYEDIRKMAGDIPVLVIETMDFGMMRADKIWKQVKELLNKSPQR